MVSLVSKLDPHKAYGFDGIPLIVVKKCAPEVAPVHCKFYNKCISTFCFPVCWLILFFSGYGIFWINF